MENKWRSTSKNNGIITENGWKNYSVNLLLNFPFAIHANTVNCTIFWKKKNGVRRLENKHGDKMD